MLACVFVTVSAWAVDTIELLANLTANRTAHTTEGGDITKVVIDSNNVSPYISSAKVLDGDPSGTPARVVAAYSRKSVRGYCAWIINIRTISAGPVDFSNIDDGIIADDDFSGSICLDHFVACTLSATSLDQNST